MRIEDYLKDYSEEDQKKFWDKYNESERIQDEFMKQYEIDHECCPECGETSHISHLLAFVFDPDNPESYEDRNTCFCDSCESQHRKHDRVKKK